MNGTDIAMVPGSEVEVEDAAMLHVTVPDTPLKAAILLDWRILIDHLHDAAA
jgi:hypothetical protein